MQPQVLHIAEIGVRVHDLPTMVAFYHEFLGFDVVHATATAVFLKVGELRSPLGAVGHPQLLVLFDRGVAADTACTTLDHLAFEIPSTEYGRVRQHLQARGLVVRERSWPESLAWRARSLFFGDPEGNTIELIAHDPAAE